MTQKQPIIRIQNVTKIFNRTVTAVDDVSLDIAEGEFFALLGPSGCGKTTLLRMIAGFENPTTGRIVVDGQDMEGVDPNHRPVNMVFQSYAVFPHMTVAKNVAYGLKVTGVSDEGDKKTGPGGAGTGEARRVRAPDAAPAFRRAAAAGCPGQGPGKKTKSSAPG